MQPFQPEIGQLCFGQPWQKFEASNLLIASLREIARKLEIVQWNKNQEEYESPFDNTSNSFKNEIFEVEAYSWNDKIEQKYNFKWKDIEISWYKRLGRSTTVNREMTTNEIEQMLNECLLSLEKFDEESN